MKTTSNDSIKQEVRFYSIDKLGKTHTRKTKKLFQADSLRDFLSLQDIKNLENIQTSIWN